MRLLTLNNKKSAVLDVAPAFEAAFDLAVAGLGTAGAELAIMAAQKGMSVLGVERANAMGGAGTIGGVWDYYYGTPGGAWEARDIDEERRAGEGYAHRAAVRSLVAEEAAVAAGARLCYETSVVGVWMQENKACGLRLVTNGRVWDVSAKIVADATGNGAVLRMAGCDYSFGRAWDGAQMAYSRAVGHVEKAGVFSRYTFSGHATDPSVREYTRAILKGSIRPPCLWEQEAERVVMHSAVMGFREEGNVIARETATFEQAIKGQRTDKPIFYSFTTQDLSNVNRDYAFEDDAFQDWMALCELARYGFSVAIPYGALLPKGFDGLLAVGKHLGVDHDLAGGIRMKRDMKKCAEAAAYAAFLAVRDEKPLDEINYGELADMLRQSGCLDSDFDVGMADLHQPLDEKGCAKSARLPQTPEEFRAALGKDMVNYPWSMPGTIEPPETASPALALFAACLMRDQPVPAVGDALAGWIEAGDAYADNYAVALGLMGDARACERLRRMLVSPVRRVEKVYPIQMKAICLLGRLCDAQAAPILLAIVEDNAKELTARMVTVAKYKTPDELAYAVLSYALFALAKIADEHAGLREEIAARLHAWAEKPFACVTGWNPRDRADSLREIVRRLWPFSN